MSSILSAVMTDDEQKTVDLVRAVREAAHAEQVAAAAVQGSLKGDASEDEREKLGVTLRDARQAVAIARVALVEHAMGGAV